MVCFFIYFIRNFRQYSVSFYQFIWPLSVPTPSKIPKIDSSSISANGCPPPEPKETTVPPLEIQQHFQPYPTNFTQTSSTYPAVFPPTNISVPPPSVNAINHIASVMRHLGTPGSIRSNPPTPSSGQPFQPYGYQANATYFPTANPPMPNQPQRPYYPPQPWIVLIVENIIVYIINKIFVFWNSQFFLHILSWLRNFLFIDFGVICRVLVYFSWRFCESNRF